MMHGGFGMMPGSWMMLLTAIPVVVPVWRICAKAGYAVWLGLLIVVPIANLLLLYFLGFADWPLERRASADASPAS
jgi:hypothetical protein